MESGQSEWEGGRENRYTTGLLSVFPLSAWLSASRNTASMSLSLFTFRIFTISLLASCALLHQFEPVIGFLRKNATTHSHFFSWLSFFDFLWSDFSFDFGHLRFCLWFWVIFRFSFYFIFQPNNSQIDSVRNSC